jgi:hypothetical protein
VIRDETHLHAAIRYVVDNPVKAAACDPGDEWLWTRVDLDQLPS